VNAPGGNAMSWHSRGLATRTRRVRPSEKTAFRAIWGLCPLGDRSWAWPPRGGAGSARPGERYWLHPRMSPLGYRAIVNGCGGNEMSRSTCSFAMRTHRVRPSEKTAFRAIPGPSPARPPHFGSPLLEGRAPHARGKGIGSIRACPRGRPGPARPSRENGIPRHTFGHTMWTHGVRPSEKTAFRVISGLSPLGDRSWAWPPAEGRAPHARGKGIGSTPACPR